MAWEKFRVVPFEVKDLQEKSDRYEFKGFASVFHTEDRVKDVVEPGAFKRTMDHNDGKFPLCWMHNREEIIGGTKMFEVDKGWFADPGYLIKGIQKAEEAYLLMKSKVIDGMSFAYRAIQKSYKGNVRHLKELAVGEITVGPRTMIAHPDALITDVKFDDNMFNEYLDKLRGIIGVKLWEDEKGWTEIKYRVRPPDDFERLRRWPIKANSIIAVGGPLKSGGGAKIQALRFLKAARWNLASAKQWVAEHKDDLKFYDVSAITSFAITNAIEERKAS